MFEPSETLYDSIDTDVENWDELDPDVQSDLLEWLNVTNSKEGKDWGEVKARLVALYVGRCFRAWDCPQCEGKGEHTRVFRGDPENWDQFQNVLNQDFAFFGDKDKYTPEYIDAMCDSCRCHG